MERSKGRPEERLGGSAYVAGAPCAKRFVQVSHVRDMLPGYHQKMSGCDRSNRHESHGDIVFVNDAGRRLACHDVTEHTVAHRTS